MIPDLPCSFPSPFQLFSPSPLKPEEQLAARISNSYVELAKIKQK